MLKERTVKHCRSAIKSLLIEHADAPLWNMREEDFRSSLLQKLRNKIADKVKVALKKDKGDGELSIDKVFRKKAFTSRVHAEVRLIPEDGKRRQTYDIVVLKDRLVAFRVRQSGTDVLEKLSLEDVAVVIEIKAGPSNRLHKRFRDDIAKLKNLSHTRRILVIIDKAMPLGMPPVGNRSPNTSWQRSLKKRVKEAMGVEVWYLNDNKKPECRFAVSR